MSEERRTIEAFEAEFRRYRSLAERAIEQVDWAGLRVSLDPETNSIAVIMKHIGGNLRSRWSDPLTSDGEKPWRNRDNEFVDDFPDRASLMDAWNGGWQILEASLASMSDGDLGRMITIRGEPHTLILALTRSVTHTAYHVGQIVQICRVLASRAGADWKTLTVARGGSSAYNSKLGYKPSNSETPGA